MKRDSLSLLGLSWDFAIIAGRAGAGRAAPCCAVCLALFWFSYVLKSKSTLRRERRDWWRFRPTSFPWDLLLSKCQAVVLGESWTTLRELLFQEWVLHSLACFPCFCRTSDFLSLILFWKCGGAVPCDKPWRILNSTVLHSTKPISFLVSFCDLADCDCPAVLPGRVSGGGCHPCGCDPWEVISHLAWLMSGKGLILPTSCSDSCGSNNQIDWLGKSLRPSNSLLR